MNKAITTVVVAATVGLGSVVAAPAANARWACISIDGADEVSMKDVRLQPLKDAGTPFRIHPCAVIHPNTGGGLPEEVVPLPIP